MTPRGTRCGQPDRGLAGVRTANADWRPDGRKEYVFTSDRATPAIPAGRLRGLRDESPGRVEADAAHVQRLRRRRRDVIWSPDGRSLIVQRDLDPVRGQSDYDLFVMRADGRHERNLTNFTGVDETSPDWSPDGDGVAFASDRDGDYEVYTMKPDGSRVRRLTTNPASEDEPSWSPDGRTLAFTSDRDPVKSSGFAFDIYTMRADGGSADPADGGRPRRVFRSQLVAGRPHDHLRQLPRPRPSAGASSTRNLHHASGRVEAHPASRRTWRSTACPGWRP